MIPAASWNEEPTRTLTVNTEWVSHILGALEVLDQDDTWNGTDEERDAARQQVREIIVCLATSCGAENMITDLRQAAGSGQLEMFRDGAWEAVPTADNVRADGSVPMTDALTILTPNGVGLRVNRSTTMGLIFNMGGALSDDSQAVRAAINASLIDSNIATWRARVTLTVRGVGGGVGTVLTGDMLASGAPAAGFLGAAAVARQVVTGSRGGNAALASLLAALASFGLITDSSS